MSKSKDHLKFTLFPFVSILLAVVGVLLFLTMVQAVMLKGDDKEEEERKKQKEENSRVYERIPELNTSVLTFSEDYFEMTRPDGSSTKYSDREVSLLIEDINKKILMVNFDRAENEESRREHLLLVVEATGSKRYFSFFQKIKINASIKNYLPTGLVLLNPGEKFNLK